MAPAAVLVVDSDMVSNRASVVGLLQAEFRAKGVTDPAEALKELRQKIYNLILLEAELPGTDGMALCEEIRGSIRHRRTPIIFIVGLDDSKTRARAIIRGGNDLITRPILPAELTVKVIRQLLEHRVSLGRSISVA